MMTVSYFTTIASVYRIAVGPNQGRKAFTLQTLPAWEDDGDARCDLATTAGFSLHAGVAARANERDKVRSRSEQGAG